MGLSSRVWAPAQQGHGSRRSGEEPECPERLLGYWRRLHPLDRQPYPRQDYRFVAVRRRLDASKPTIPLRWKKRAHARNPEGLGLGILRALGDARRAGA